MKGPILGLMLMASCPTYTGRSITVDLRDSTAEIHWVVVGKGASDLDGLVQDYLEGDELNTHYPKWTITAKRLEPAGDQLHGVAEIEWSAVGDVGFVAPARPGYALRFCPPHGEWVQSANAHARTRSGCVLWKPGVQVLRVQTVVRPQGEEQSLLPWYREREDSKKIESVRQTPAP